MASDSSYSSLLVTTIWSRGIRRGEGSPAHTRVAGTRWHTDSSYSSLLVTTVWSREESYTLTVPCLNYNYIYVLPGSNQVVCSADHQTAPVGGNVTLLCQLALERASPDVLQVTWRKQSGNFTGTIATYSGSHGQRFLGPYSQRKTRFTKATLDTSAITIYSVTLGDQGCFQCIFNVYPLGANTGTVCVEVMEPIISDPKLEILPVVYPDTSGKVHVISCSATGIPAPYITWNLTENLQERPQVYRILHPNQTVTVISNFTHADIGRGQRVNVSCVVYHPALDQDLIISKSIE
ncbi:hypothetical protein GDO86_002654, partial [Hymenochirus boettgeri]